MKQVYLEPTQEAAVALFSQGLTGEVIMLNLLRFKETADYSNNPILKPSEPVTGQQAFNRYINHTKPFLKKTGGELMLLADTNRYFIGPPEERWDMAMLVKQNSLNDFMSFASNAEYLKGIGHRTAALEDSRLLPMFNLDSF